MNEVAHTGTPILYLGFSFLVVVLLEPKERGGLTLLGIGAIIFVNRWPLLRQAGWTKKTPTP